MNESGPNERFNKVVEGNRRSSKESERNDEVACKRGC
jgi:hypothetical protein